MLPILFCLVEMLSQFSISGKPHSTRFPGHLLPGIKSGMVDLVGQLKSQILPTQKNRFTSLYLFRCFFEDLEVSGIEKTFLFSFFPASPLYKIKLYA